MKVEISKPFLFVENKSKPSVQNLQGQIGIVKYKNNDGAMLKLKSGAEVFVPRAAMKRV